MNCDVKKQIFSQLLSVKERKEKNRKTESAFAIVRNFRLFHFDVYLEAQERSLCSESLL